MMPSWYYLFLVMDVLWTMAITVVCGVALALCMLVASLHTKDKR